MSDNFTENKSKLPSHIAYSVESGNGDKEHWQKIGAAWPAKDDGLSLQLKALPLDGKIALRSREELERMRAEKQQQAQGQTQEQSQKQAIKPEQ